MQIPAFHKEAVFNVNLSSVRAPECLLDVPSVCSRMGTMWAIKRKTKFRERILTLFGFTGTPRDRKNIWHPAQKGKSILFKACCILSSASCYFNRRLRISRCDLSSFRSSKRTCLSCKENSYNARDFLLSTQVRCHWCHLLVRWYLFTLIAMLTNFQDCLKVPNC